MASRLISLVAVFVIFLVAAGTNASKNSGIFTNGIEKLKEDFGIFTNGIQDHGIFTDGIELPNQNFGIVTDGIIHTHKPPGIQGICNGVTPCPSSAASATSTSDSSTPIPGITATRTSIITITTSTKTSSQAATTSVESITIAANPGCSTTTTCITPEQQANPTPGMCDTIIDCGTSAYTPTSKICSTTTSCTNAEQSPTPGMCDTIINCGPSPNPTGIFTSTRSSCSTITTCINSGQLASTGTTSGMCDTIVNCNTGTAEFPPLCSRTHGFNHDLTENPKPPELASSSTSEKPKPSDNPVEPNPSVISSSETPKESSSKPQESPKHNPPVNPAEPPKPKPQSYKLKIDVQPDNFYEHFDFRNPKDPSSSFTRYLSFPEAVSKKLYQVTETITQTGDRVKRLYIGVDHENKIEGKQRSDKDDPNYGRPSVRVESKKTFDHGLFVLDVDHAPWGCGVWPAFWTFGIPSPNYGEIDILEGINLQKHNSIILHTLVNDKLNPSCSYLPSTNTTASEQTGIEVSKGSDCSSTSTTYALHVTNRRGGTYGGPNFRGAVFAMEWKEKEEVQIWGF
ncbi:Similar to Endo-1,3(4)-beta-glucanase xgeA; acc. no. Q5BAP5 [Pyronema omphalodes CBS 100304]|uniref:Similar to Endo-1,3(4)-beta-glucanase xgeA acc. no. Q5BAP5 n=1 Tax=Pyronema omphalodes (strain CBS 100304) TaxID=1076935 RepID=U4LCE8_PYROM|nr:Similar to Endo-1,3(4)-beta-glucanase xgeA; acc. no. Q5BAP5 [Pyronema omphalodes CBS 100304]